MLLWLPPATTPPCLTSKDKRRAKLLFGDKKLVPDDFFYLALFFSGIFSRAKLLFEDKQLVSDEVAHLSSMAPR